MRSLAVLIGILYSSTSIGQQLLLANDYKLPIKSWRYEDFKQKGIREVKAYSFLGSELFNKQKDTLLIYSQSYDTASNSILSSIYIRPSTNGNWIDIPDVNSKETYAKDGLLLLIQKWPIELSQVKTGAKMKLIEQTTVDSFSYNSDKQLLSSTQTEQFHQIYLKGKKGNDSSKTSNIKKSGWKYEYAADGKQTNIYRYVDKTKIISPKKKSKSVCVDCNPQYLYSKTIKENEELTYEYDYLPDGKLNFKRIIISKNQQPLKLIDTVYSYCPDCTFMAITEDYYYNETNLVKTVRREKVKNREIKYITFYNKQGDITELCTYKDSFETPEYCEPNEYKYEYGRKVYEKHTNYQGNVYENFYTYDNRGLLVEEKKIGNGIILQWIFYKY